MEFEEPEAEASLLDLLLVVAENLKLLLLGPLLAGLVALGDGDQPAVVWTGGVAAWTVLGARDGGHPAPIEDH